MWNRLKKIKSKINSFKVLCKNFFTLIKNSPILIIGKKITLALIKIFIILIYITEILIIQIFKGLKFLIKQFNDYKDLLHPMTPYNAENEWKSYKHGLFLHIPISIIGLTLYIYPDLLSSIVIKAHSFFTDEPFKEAYGATEALRLNIITPAQFPFCSEIEHFSEYHSLLQQTWVALNFVLFRSFGLIFGFICTYVLELCIIPRKVIHNIYFQALYQSVIVTVCVCVFSIPGGCWIVEAARNSGLIWAFCTFFTIVYRAYRNNLDPVTTGYNPGWREKKTIFQPEIKWRNKVNFTLIIYLIFYFLFLIIYVFFIYCSGDIDELINVLGGQNLDEYGCIYSEDVTIDGWIIFTTIIAIFAFFLIKKK